MTDEERPATARESAFMRRALALARKGWGQTAPNPMVGAVVVSGGVIVGEGWHARYGGPHAEVAALEAAGERARGATVYVTLEPCAHHGKTPPCADAIVRAGVARVVAATRDPGSESGGGGERLEQAGIRFESGLEERAARELNAPFFHAFRSDRPWVVLKLAVSIDGALADAKRSKGWLTGDAARREVHRLRAGADAIAVGIGTVLADDPRLTVRDAKPPRVPPRRVVFDRHARLPLESELARTVGAAPITVVAMQPEPGNVQRLEAAGIEVLTVASLQAALRTLARAGIRSMFIEGGSELAGALLTDALVDRLIIFQAPIVLGTGALNAFATAPPEGVSEATRLDILERRAFGTDLMTIYAITTL